MRKKKDLIKVLIILLVVAIGLGYAYINSDLKINGTAQVKNVNWDVHWANIQVKTGSVTGTNVVTAPAISNQTTVNFSVILPQPGTYYEFTLDAVNSGSMDAMIDTMDFKLNGATMTNQPDYLRFVVTYSDGVTIEENHLLAANTTETYKVRVEYRDDIELSQLPAGDQTLNLQVTTTYRQATDDAVNRPIPRRCATINTDSSGGGGNATMSGLTLMMKNSTQGEDNPSWFTDSAANQSQAGVYTRKGTSNDKYPIYYYRGRYASVNNNLIFNNFCWKIVRTTATGGIRIIYNGRPVRNGQCTTQIASTTYIQKAAFNTLSDDPKYVGYVYDDNGTPTDSNLKTVLETWYNTNMSNVDNKIETSIYCNDTSEWGDDEYLDEDVLTAESNEAFSDSREYGGIDYCSVFRSIKGTPTTICPNSSDEYSLKVGFLTLDEEMLAGRDYYIGMEDYLYNGDTYWLGSPDGFYYNQAYVTRITNNFGCYGRIVDSDIGVRPVVSLVPNTSYSGTGTTTDPFVVS